MIYKLIEASNVIANVQDTFNIDDSDWIGRSANWINKALVDIGVMSELAILSETSKAIDFRVELPCDIKSLVAVEIKGFRIYRTNNVTKETYNSELGVTYNVNGNNYITIDSNDELFKDIEVTVHYKSLPVAIYKPYGVYLPLIPDVDVAQDAIANYVMIKLLGRGYMHPVFNLTSQSPATNPYLAYYGIPGRPGFRQRARIKVKTMDADARERVSVSTRSFNHPDRHDTLDFNKQY